MKADTHPQWYPDAKVKINGEVIMTVGATKPELNVEVWSGTHPFYTGQQRLLDTEGQVDRFLRRLQRREQIQTELEKKEDESNPLNMAVDGMSLGTRAERALAEADVVTAGDIVKLLEQGDDALLAVPGVGRKALIDIKRFLRAEGLIE